MGYRVVQWSTSAGGRLTLRGIIGHPDLELVGVWVDSDGELGLDAGELAGVGPVGVAATNDVAALLALIPDCVCFTAPADERPQEALEDLTRILSSGANVISPRIAAAGQPRIRRLPRPSRRPPRKRPRRYWSPTSSFPPRTMVAQTPLVSRLR